MLGPKEHDVWPKFNIFKGKHYILKIWGAPNRQKLDMILKNIEVEKLKLKKDFAKNDLRN